MKRRHFLRYASTSLVGLTGTIGLSNGLSGGLFDRSAAQAAQSGLQVQYLGHTCFLLSGGGQRVLVNPFRSVGCTAGYRAPKVKTDLVLISSQLLDEGAVDVVPGNPKLLAETGSYNLGNAKIQGIGLEHDRLGGKQFGQNIAWKWQQGGLNLLHLGGAAGPISLEQKILLGASDVLFLPVGGGPKAYTAEEAKQAIQVLQPKLVIPTQYRTKAAKDQCDLVGVEEFLTLMKGASIRRSGDIINLSPGDLPKQGVAIQVMSYKF